MSILFVLLTFLVIISISYYRHRKDEPAVQPEVMAALPATPEMLRESGFDVPRGYCFHPGHTWAFDEGRQNARVGVDSFAAHLLGKIARIEVIGMNRWVRQGQKICTVTANDLSVDLLSPVEGVVSTVNHEVLRDPGLAVKDPYRTGWICVVKAPELTTNVRNLLQGTFVLDWMRNSVKRLNSYAAPLGAAAADGGVPISGIISQLDPGSQRKLLQEFFLN